MGLTAVHLAAFVFLILLGIRVLLSRSAEPRRTRILQLAAYIVVGHLAVGLSQKDAWPITNYRLLHGLAPPTGELSFFEMYGVDRSGREWRIDPYAWRSISHWHLHFWLWVNFKNLKPAQQDEVIAWLYRLAERQRAELAAGDQSISPLGRISAPEWYLIRRQTSVPHEPYRGLRIYLETFTVGGAIVEARGSANTQLDRRLVGEWNPH
jgi:hypothetical protein